jgi:hypothetical protein
MTLRSVGLEHQLAEIIIDAALWDARKKREPAKATARSQTELERSTNAARRSKGEEGR